MCDEIKLEEIYRDLLLQISLPELLNKMSVCIGRSLVVADISFRVLGYSTDYQITDPIWKENVERGYCTYSFMREVFKLEPDIFKKNNMEPFLINCDYSEENKLLCPVYFEQQLIAYLLLLDNQKGIKDSFYELMRHFSIMISFELRQTPNYHRLFGDMEEHIIAELLDNGDIELADSRLKACGISLPPLMRCVACRLKDTSALDSKYVVRTLRQLFADGILLTQEGYILCITSEDILKRIDKKHTESLEKVVECIGIGPAIKHVRQLMRGCLLAIKTCEIHDALRHDSGKYSGEKFLRIYNEYKFYNLLLSCKDRDVLLDNIHPSLHILREYDQENEGNLMETLRHFLEQNQSINDTAEAMYVHRNTINYRLTRIRSLTGIDWTDYHERLELENSFQIMDVI